jgi:WD40 repeat protein
MLIVAETMRAYLVFLPVTFLAVLQTSGCSGGTPGQSPPGGVYLSRSAGAHFDQAVDLADEEDGENIASFVLRGADRPDNRATEVYVAAGNNGVVFSNNGGEDWQVITTPLTSVSDVVALNNGVLVAAGTDSDGQGFVLRSADQGLSWQNVLTIPAPVKERRTLIGGSTQGSQSVVISIAADPFNDDHIYAGTSLGNVLLGEQSAKTWRTISTLDDGSIISGQNQGKMAIVDIVPSPDKVGEVMLITTDGTLWRLSPEEKKEITIPRNLQPTSQFSFSGRSREVKSVAFVADEADVLLVGVDDGAVLSRDRGANWQELPLPIDVTKQFNSVVVAVSPTNATRILVGINGVVYRSEDGGRSWNTFSLGLKNHAITSLLIDPSNASNVVAVTTPLGS